MIEKRHVTAGIHQQIEVMLDTQAAAAAAAAAAVPLALSDTVLLELTAWKESTSSAGGGVWTGEGITLGSRQAGPAHNS